MAARTLPTAPTWSANQEITSTQLNQISAYLQFWANPPSFRAEQHVTQSFPNNATTQVTCETPIHDSDSGLSATAPYSYVVPFAGVWDFFGGAGLATATAGLRIVAITQNGSTLDGAGAVYAQAADPGVFYINAPQIICNVGDVIGLTLYQNSGAAVNSPGTSYGPQWSWFSGCLRSLQTP
ncbi:hypothetical protein P3T36_006905 [Kitasatospora sp. MAP12-15]|uniref:hypothetical protein n=1 Tax=unclassified Kitasatospora TaxID=2633591 RepID=UPI0024772CCD|nr:hypothetical protein [Kitasatospora sp. MAP12-44]MDH6111912.1 hypothetical protein [Kitasatospora sp. MAP12-44]